MTIWPEDRIIIRELYQNRGWINLYSIHLNYLLSPGQMGRSVRKLLIYQVIEQKGLNIRFNEKGFIWVLKNKKEIFLTKSNRYWLQLPQDMVKREREKDTPYMPNSGLLSKRFFSRLK